MFAKFKLFILLFCFPLLSFSYFSIGASIGSVANNHLADANKGEFNNIQAGTSVNYASNYNYSVTAGYTFLFTKVDIEYMYYYANAKNVGNWFGTKTPISGNISSHAFIVNGHLFMPTIIKPYCGFGVGIININKQTGNYQKKTGFMYQGILGIAFGVRGYELFFDYKYSRTVSDNIFNTYYRLHSFNLGITVRID